MKKLISAALVFLMSLPVFAALKDPDAAAAPAPTVDMVYVVIFGVIFLGAIIGFFIYLFMTDKGDKGDKPGE